MFKRKGERGMKTHVDEMVYDIANAFTKAAEFDRMMQLPSCNGCEKYRECEYAPKFGEPIRINCPLREVEKK